MQHVVRWNGSAWEPVPSTGDLGKTNAYARFCSADLASSTAYYNPVSKKGTGSRIFLNGEESGPVYQRALAHVATGKNKGISYQLPWAENLNTGWENLLASPKSGDKTVVIGNSDGGTNGLYVYVGDKKNTGNDVEKAGLIGGTVYRVAVNGNAAETRAKDAGLGMTINTSSGHYEHGFTLVTTEINTNNTSTKFLRPEDGAWDVKDSNRYYFVTTDQNDAAKDDNLNTDITTGQQGRSRLWVLKFSDVTQPELGGTIELLLDGTVADGDYQMFDNMTVNYDGTLVLQEDVGNNQHSGKIWIYNPLSGYLKKVAGFDTTLFGDIGVTPTVTKDEESSGVIDITGMLAKSDNKVYNLFVAQNHALSGDPETVEGGQLLIMSYPKGAYYRR